VGLKEVAAWGEIAQTMPNHPKLLKFERDLVAQEEKMKTLLEEEQIILGVAGKAEGLPELRSWFNPYYDLWATAHKVITKKKEWMASAILHVLPSEVDELVMQSSRLIARLKRALPAAGAPARALGQLQSEVNDLAEYCPVVEVLCDKSLRPRHWLLIQQTIKSGIGPEDLALS
jgi:hypothetical protein